MLDTQIRKIFFREVKDANSLTSFIFFSNFTFLVLIVFFSWNYFGFLFIIYIYSIFSTIDKYRNSSFKEYFLHTLLHIIAFHVGVLFWMFKIKNGIPGFFISVLYYLIPYILFFLFNKYIKQSLIAFVFIFILFEFSLDEMNFSFPWLIIGNCLSNSNVTPQIYEFIGSIGGSFFLLLITFLLFVTKKTLHKILIIIITLSFIYILGICLIKNKINLKDSKKTINCLFFNPDKYIKRNKYYNNEELAFFIKKKTTSKFFDKIFIPELTFKSLSFNNFEKSIVCDYFKEICSKDSSQIYFGASGVLKKGNLSNLFIKTDGKHLQKKAKEKLVPYSEFTPKILRNILTDNISFDYIDYHEWKINKVKNKELPLICYEVIYSNYVNKNVDDTNLIILITSEKFFNNSFFGMNQYNNIIRLRAIETRKPIIKSSNAGLSFFMNKFGKIENSSEKEFSSIKVDKADLTNNLNTFYTEIISKFNLYFYINIILIILIILKK